jgi:hypothetical protein
VKHWSRHVFRAGLAGFSGFLLLAVYLAVLDPATKQLQVIGNELPVRVGGFGGTLFILCGIVLLAVDVSGLRRTWSELDKSTRWLVAFALLIGHFGTSYFVYYLLRDRFFGPRPTGASAGTNTSTRSELAQ